MTPNLVRVSLGGKLTGVQAALFGFEGYLNAPQSSIYFCSLFP